MQCMLKADWHFASPSQLMNHTLPLSVTRLEVGEAAPVQALPRVLGLEALQALGALLWCDPGKASLSGK